MADVGATGCSGAQRGERRLLQPGRSPLPASRFPASTKRCIARRSSWQRSTKDQQEPRPEPCAFHGMVGVREIQKVPQGLAQACSIFGQEPPVGGLA